MILNIRGVPRVWDTPVVMGIINVTPDSFFEGSRVRADDMAAVCGRAGRMLAEGAQILDLGGYSTRPGAGEVSADEECARLVPAVRAIRREYPDAVISVDTFRASVASACVEAGADIINDIGGGDLDPEMFATVADLRVPYIAMHTRGTPATMGTMTDYDDVSAEVLRDLAAKADRLHSMGVADVIVDPGFGFAKTIDQNYRLLSDMACLKAIGCPVLAGISRKTMIWKELGTTPADALNGTTALNMICLLNGADILRVHDVREAVETVAVYNAYMRNRDPQPRTIREIDNI